MPDFDALQGVRQIRSAYPQLKILVVSAHADDAYVVGLLEADFLGKPTVFLLCDGLTFSVVAQSGEGSTIVSTGAGVFVVHDRSLLGSSQLHGLGVNIVENESGLIFQK